MSDFTLTSKNKDGLLIIETNGYLNNIGGEEIAKVCNENIVSGTK